MNSKQAPKRNPARDSDVWTPVEIHDPAVSEIERRIAEQDRVFRAALDGIAAAKGASADIGDELRALEQICAPTRRVVAPLPVGVFLMRC